MLSPGPEESLVRWGIPYIVWGLAYDRRDIGSAGLSAAVGESADTVSLLRVINGRNGDRQDHDSAPHRCGQSTWDSAVGRE